MTSSRLTVAIASLASRVHKIDVAMLTPQEGVDYHIFVQDAAGPVALRGSDRRSDITVTPLNSHGVTISRNAAIDSAQGDIILFADDDLTLETGAYPRLRALFEGAPALDFICGRMRDAQDKPFKAYPTDMTSASRLNTAKLGTPELAVRAKSVRAAGVTFDTRFGAGSTMWLGDEYIFICDALRAGLRGRHVDIVLATHPEPSSGQYNSTESFAIREAVLRRALGPLSWPLRCAFAWRHRKRFPNWQSLLRFLRP